MSLRIAWGLTGCGDYLEESIETVITLKKKYGLSVDVVFSKAGETVVNYYGLWGTVKTNFDRILIEKDANTPFLVGPLQLGKYGFLLLCPATANTTAKIVHGIADSLLTNCVAQAIKAEIPVYIFPADQKLGKIVTVLPSGKKLTLSMRDIDLENTNKLRKMKGIIVLSDPKDIESVVLNFLGKNEERSDS